MVRILYRQGRIVPNGLALGEIARFVIDYFLLKIKFLAKRECDFSTKLAILPNAGYAPLY